MQIEFYKSTLYQLSYPLIVLRRVGLEPTTYDAFDNLLASARNHLNNGKRDRCSIKLQRSNKLSFGTPCWFCKQSLFL